MPVNVTQLSSYQSLDTKLLEVSGGETVIAHFAAKRDAAVPWVNGGISWSARGADDADYEVAVDYSLNPAGDDDWIPDDQSPFDEPSNGNIDGRQERVRFTHTGAPVRIIVASSAKFTVAG